MTFLTTTISFSTIFFLTLIEMSYAADNNNCTDNLEKEGPQECKAGILFPVWYPQSNLSTANRAVRGVAYFLAMCYMFLGVSIVSDRFMAAIEVITAREHEIKIKKGNGETQIVTVRIWNETVANLTLMALGSSAPEILLSIIEIFGNEFESGDLGPGTIVGSAAFNLLVIIGLCIVVIPSNEIRRIKHLRVFFITATFSIFAYLWLLVILKFISPGEVVWWEALITLLCFPITVGLAYVADRRLLVYKYLSKGYHFKNGMIVEGEGGNSKTDVAIKFASDHGMKVLEEETENEEIAEFEQSRRDYIQLLRDIRKENPNISPEKLEELARDEILSKAPKSRAFYRMQASRKLVGGQNLVKKMQDKADEQQSVLDARRQSMKSASELGNKEKITHIYFDPAHYNILENAGKFKVLVVREGGDLSKTVLVDYQTEDGTASAGTDYYPVIGTLTFQPKELTKTIELEVIDDEVFEEDEHFYLRLSKPRFAKAPHNDEYSVQLTSPFLATIMILDDDHGGVFNVAEKDVEISETCGVFEAKLTRSSGARGKISLMYKTVEATAMEGKDFESSKGTVVFQNNETEKTIEINIIDTDSYEKNVVFFLDISDPTTTDSDVNQKVAALKRKNKNELTKEEKLFLEGVPRLGNDTRSVIHIKENKEFKETVDRLVQQTNAANLIGTSSWIEQFKEACTIGAGDEDDKDGEERVPSLMAYVMHFLTVFWKVGCAFIPPTSCAGGYLSFVCSILVIGVLTAAIGDIASHFGCSVGLQDSVTSIVFVALGTSIPDTFASKVAAVQDEYADASIGNVTGSNAVNVFLGIGIAWTLAAFYHQFIKKSDGPCPEQPCEALKMKKCSNFYVDPGSLAFSVSLFCTCAFVAIFVMMVRRLKIFGGGELGGPTRFKISTGILFFALWMFYVIMSSLETYKHIDGF